LHEKSSLGKPDSGNYYFSVCTAINITMRSFVYENTLLQATAQEVQNLLVSGRRKEALQYAQEGQLWGPALILALQLGDKVCFRIKTCSL